MTASKVVDGFNEVAGEAADVVVVTASDILPSIKDGDPEDQSRRIAERMLGASSLDDLYGATKGKSAEDVEGRLITITGVEWQRYESDRGEIPLAVVSYTDEMTGERSEFATAGSSLVPFLYKVQKLGEIPFKTRVVARKTRNNYTVFNFERP